MYNKMLGRFLDFMGDFFVLAVMMLPGLSAALNPWFFYKESWNEDGAWVSVSLFAIPLIICVSALPLTAPYISKIMIIASILAFAVNFFMVFLPALEGFIKGRLDLREPHSHTG